MELEECLHMVAKMKNCPSCGRLFVPLTGAQKLCPDCMDKLHEKEHEVIEYVRDHPKVKIGELGPLHPDRRQDDVPMREVRRADRPGQALPEVRRGAQERPRRCSEEDCERGGRARRLRRRHGQRPAPDERRASIFVPLRARQADGKKINALSRLEVSLKVHTEISSENLRFA